MSSLRELGFAIPAENVRAEFTPWLRWDRREFPIEGYPLHEYSGVYVLAHFDSPPPEGHANPVDPRVIYVGEGAWLGRRWYSFERSVARKPGHSAGHSYRKRYQCVRPLAHLHVAAFPIWLRESEEDPDPMDPCSLTCRLRHYVEQGLLWHLHYRKSGAELLNRK